MILAHASCMAVLRPFGPTLASGDAHERRQGEAARHALGPAADVVSAPVAVMLERPPTLGPAFDDDVDAWKKLTAVAASVFLATIAVVFTAAVV
jgi:hypothetical protein